MQCPKDPTIIQTNYHHYHQVLRYFKTIGYYCPAKLDVADFLQELPTKEGVRFIKEELRYDLINNDDNSCFKFIQTT